MEGGGCCLPSACAPVCYMPCAAFVSHRHAAALPYTHSLTLASMRRRRELERQLVGLRQQRAETEAALQRERAAGVGRQTAGELQEMITTLQVGGERAGRRPERRTERCGTEQRVDSMVWWLFISV